VVADLGLDHSSQELGVCTPFCICSCCSAHVRLINLSSFETRQCPHSAKHLSHYIANHDLNVGHSIWQPPRA
jgi:hypothetical protein